MKTLLRLKFLVLIFSLASFLVDGALFNYNQAEAKNYRKTKFLSLTIGVTRNLKVPFLPPGATFEGDFKTISKVSVAKEIKTLRFIPKKVGVATLMILNKKRQVVAEYTIDVKKSDLTKVAREIRSLLSDVEGIAVKIINNKVIVDGQILLPRDLSRIHSVVKEYGGIASTIVTLSPLAQKKIAEFIERDINVPEIHVRAVNEVFILEGYAKDEAEKQRAFIIAQTYIPDIVINQAEGKAIKTLKKKQIVNLINVKAAAAPDPKKIVQVVIHYVELQKDYSKSFSFNWNPSLEDGSSVSFQQDSRSSGGLISTITGTINNLLPKLNWSKEHGHAKVLQSSTLLILDGQKGKLSSIVDVPFVIAGPQGQPSTDFKKAGMITNVTPQIMGARSDSIALSLEFNLSSLLSMTASGPLISNNNIVTSIVVRSGQSAAVGGLISNTSGTNYNKLPASVSKNPIISLNTSKDFRRNRSQFVVFVTPIIKTSASQGAEKIKRKFRLRD